MSNPRKDAQGNNGNYTNSGSRTGSDARSTFGGTKSGQGGDTADPTRNGRPTGNGPDRGGTRSLTDTFADERDDVLAVINELEDQLDRNEQLRDGLEREVSRLTETGDKSTQRIQELEWQVAALQSNIDALSALKQENTLLEEELADANTRAARTAEQLTRTEKDAARQSEELRTATKQCEELWAVRKERDGLKVDVKNLKGRVEQLERTARDLGEERAILNTRIQETQTALDESRAERNQIELSQRALEDRNQELRQAVDTFEQKLEDARNERKGLAAQITRFERENARLIEQQQFNEVEMTSLRNMNRNAESALSNVKKAFSEVRIALSETKSRARRRSIENLPRIAGALRGIDEAKADADTDASDDDTANPAESQTSGTRKMVET